ncbi:hypothetical protein AVEN_266205-1 [Araneus ventricosus]|uniref:Ciliary microtubule inner protein 2A-C-like domain-containing protein n=1 Tax=Araneus ventricosus TaxID=182803 RepID=A0A4Y2N7X0_ARAVE|nr:hypothetical protein AVEN_266205-1 [Araneus ventricosus]
MKDYAYYIPGYTGFCPKLPEHYGQSYGKATRQILRERPCDLLKERLSDTRHRCCPDRRRGRGRVQADYGDHGFDGHCMDYADHHCGRGRHPGNHDRNGAVQFDFVRPAFFYFEERADHMPDYFHEHPHGHHKHDRGDMLHVHQPAFMTEPCQHDMHPGQAAYDRQGYDPEARMRMRPKKVPFRHCCVAPKYTGHIPGMQFVFGESFGPSSDRLLRRHHDNLKRMNAYR